MQLVSKTGVLIDNRSDYEKSKDYKHEEIASGFTTYLWEERPAKAKYFFPYNQEYSLSCVAGGGAIVLEYLDGRVISKKDIYSRRVNYPGGGMMLHDVGNILIQGACEEKYVPSQNYGENKMNERYAVTTDIIKSRANNKIRSYFYVSKIDDIASVIKTSPVICFWFFDENGREWKKHYPEIQFNFPSFVGSGVTRHQVAIVDAILINGKKYLVGQDTWGLGTGDGTDGNIRYISEEMVSKRMYGAIYSIDDEVLKPETIEKPVYNYNTPLTVGAKGDQVMALHRVLIHEGLLNIPAPTGFFAGLTRKAVKDLQTKYKSEILTPVGLKNATGYVGKSTNAFLNKKYGHQ